MDSHHRKAHIWAHVDSMSRRSALETTRLTASLRHDCWPGGGVDRSEPAALGWVRRWRPARACAIVPDCTCRDGYCPICN